MDIQELMDRLLARGRWPGLMVALLMMTAGFGLMQLAGASTYSASGEAENGTLAGNTVAGDTNGASGGAAVKFGVSVTPPTTPPVTPPAAKPGPTNTGVPAGTALTVVNGNQTYTTPGQVISGLDVRGKVIIKADNITFKNSIVHGPAAGGCTNGGAIENQGENTLIQDVEVVMDHPTACLDGIWLFDGKATVTRANIHGGVDGVKTGSHILIQDSWIHDMQWFASDPNQGGGATHNDGVQSFQGDTDVTLRHNNIDLSGTKDGNAAWQNSASNSHAENNWLDGGGCTLNFAHGQLPSLTNMYVTNNRFGRHQAFNGCVLLISTKTVMTQYAGNVWDDTGQPVPNWQQHD